MFLFNKNRKMNLRSMPNTKVEFEQMCRTCQIPELIPNFLSTWDRRKFSKLMLYQIVICLYIIYLDGMFLIPLIICQTQSQFREGLAIRLNLSLKSWDVQRLIHIRQSINNLWMGEIFVAKFGTLHDTSILVRKKSFSKICIAKKNYYSGMWKHTR